MNDADDYEVDIDNQELVELDTEYNASDKEHSVKRDIRAEIEKRLELKELKRLMEDSYNDIIFDWERTKVNYFKGSGACGISASPAYKKIDISVANKASNQNARNRLGTMKFITQNTNEQRRTMFTD